MRFSASRLFGVLFFCLWFWASWSCEAQPTPSSSSSSPSAKSRQVRFIQFKGTKAHSPGELKKVLSTKEKRFRWFSKAPLDEGVLKEDLERLEKFYRSQGFYEARVTDTRIEDLAGSDVRVVITVEEGMPTKVAEIHLQVNGEASGPWHDEMRRLLPLRVGERFTIPNYQGAEKAILGYAADWGYPKATVDMKARLDKSTHLGEVWFDVTMGPVCFFGDIRLEGNARLADEIILRELKFKPGERFSAGKIQESQQRLYNLELFQFVDLSVENLEGKETVLPVRVLVKEGKPQTIRLGAGYGTEDQFRGQVQWEVRNFLGDGRRLEVSAKASSLVQLLESEFTQPYLWDERSTLTVESGVKQEDQESFENRKVFVSPLLNYKWTERLTTHAGYSLEANRLLSVSVLPDALGPGDQENQDYYISSLLGGAGWERVDNAINPSRGLRFFDNMEWASIGLGSEVDFFKFTIEGRGYVPLNKTGVLAGKIKVGTIQELENTDDIPIFKRFFAGGTDSVRGYPYQKLGPLDQDGNPLGGLSLFEGSVEWRFPVRKFTSLEGVAFFDFGNVFEDSFEFFSSDLGYSVGGGLRYLTLVGPLRLDFGYQLNPPEGDFYSPYQVHFSIGQAF